MNRNSKKVFFFEKKNQKIFVTLDRYEMIE